MASYSYDGTLDTDWNGLSADYRFALPGYFETMGVSLLRGRLFDDQDNETLRAVAIVDETLARQAWPNEDAVGKRLGIGLGTALEEDVVEVIGVVEHSRIINVRERVRPQIYLHGPGDKRRPDHEFVRFGGNGWCPVHPDPDGNPRRNRAGAFIRGHLQRHHVPGETALP
jgi:hypothetical protein